MKNTHSAWTADPCRIEEDKFVLGKRDIKVIFQFMSTSKPFNYDFVIHYIIHEFYHPDTSM